jgi:hypothetical protein
MAFVATRAVRVLFTVQEIAIAEYRARKSAPISRSRALNPRISLWWSSASSGKVVRSQGAKGE